jgi:hypothetical protein
VLEAILPSSDFSYESSFCFFIHIFEDLETHVLVSLGVFGKPSHSKAAISEWFDQAVVLDHLI